MWKSCEFQVHVEVHHYASTFQILQLLVPFIFFSIISSYLFCAGIIQRWGIPVETTRKPYSSCQGICVQDEQQSCTEKKQFVSIGTTVLPSCICLFDLEFS
jgi:hypothetical protein